MRFPIGDWQFWVVTAAVVVVVLIAARPYLPWRKRKGTSRRVDLTIGRERPERRG